MNPTDDDVLRQALNAEAARITSRPDWDDVVRRAGGANRRRAWPVLPAVAAALALLALAVGALVVLDDDPAVQVTTDPEPTIPTTVPDDDPSDPVPAAGRDFEPLELPAGAPLPAGQLVALVARGDEEPSVDLVVLSADGAVLRTLVAGVDASEGGLYNLHLSPDRRTVLAARGTSACEAVVVAVAVDGTGSTVEVTAGNGAALSPDRSVLALDPRSSCMPDDQIELVPVAGGRSTIYGERARPLAGLGDGAQDFSGGVGSLAFLDESTVAYTSGTQDERSLWVLDRDLGTARRFDGPADHRWITARGDGTMDVVFDEGGTSFVGIADADGVLVSEEVPDGVRRGSLTTAGVVRLGEDGRLTVDGTVVASNVRDVVATDPGRLVAPTAGADQLTEDEQAQAATVVRAFLDAFRAGDVDAQAERWSGYPVSEDDDGKRAALARLAFDADWSSSEPVDLLVHPAWAFGEADAVVTAVFAEPQDRPLSFLVGVGAGPFENQIIRLPEAILTSIPTPAPGSEVDAGTSIVIPGIPVEGGARAFVDGEEVAIGIDRENQRMTVVVPVGASGRIVVVVTTATPEEPAVGSWSYIVR